jgi:8-oxo-dGTP diphosphatase
MSKNFHEVSTVIVVDHNKFLILQRSKEVNSGSGFWNFPGGSVEPGEPLEVAGTRELKEESGIDVDPKSLKYVGNISRGELRVHFFITSEFSGELDINYESSDYRWITAEEVQNYLFPGGTLHPDLINEIERYIGE